MDVRTSNFDFLRDIDSKLLNLGRLSETFFHDDPSTSIIKLRQFCERLAQRHAASAGLNVLPGTAQADLLRELKLEKAAPEQVLDIFHHIRKLGNQAVHDGHGDHLQALGCMKMAVQLGVWHARIERRDPRFKVPPFVPPVAPSSASAELRKEIERLRSERNNALSEAERVVAELEAERARAEDARHREIRQAEERKAWEELAQEAEAESQRFRQELEEMRATASQRTHTQDLAFQTVTQTAAGAIDLDEQATRALIDVQLRDRGWEADSVELTFAKGVRPAKGRNLAISEWPTKSGPADYALFVGEQCVGIVEAKRYRKNISAAIDQAERYSKGIDWPANSQVWCGEYFVPFVFATNGRPYLKQVETESGIWFRDARLAQNLRRALMGWFKPDELLSMLEVEKEKAQAALAARSFDFGFQLRPYQKAAIEAVEKTLATEKREMLVAMATGTGKTKLAIAMLYRLLSTKRFRRICFVVDRSALGTQTSDEFMSTAIEGPKTFGQLFGLMGLEDIKPDPETRVHICTIQGLVKRVLYNSEPSDVPPIGQYDLMVIDECHRGYLLDREMSDAELSFRGQDDYISKYRRVLEHFDAVKIGC